MRRHQIRMLIFTNTLCLRFNTSKKGTKERNAYETNQIKYKKRKEWRKKKKEAEEKRF